LPTRALFFIAGEGRLAGLNQRQAQKGKLRIDAGRDGSSIAIGDSAIGMDRRFVGLRGHADHKDLSVFFDERGPARIAVTSAFLPFFVPMDDRFGQDGMEGDLGALLCGGGRDLRLGLGESVAHDADEAL
jgi:hypothetical protein